MRSIVFKPTMPAVITKFTTAALLLLALAACNSGGGGGAITGKSNSLTPTELVATGFYQGVDLSWNKAKGAISYTVYYHTASFDSSADTDSATGIRVKSKPDITADNTSITGLDNGTTYYFRVIASNPSGNSAMSQIQSATTKITLAEPNPKAAASINSLAAVDLSWDIVAGVTGYTIYYDKQKSNLNNPSNLGIAQGSKLVPTGISSTIDGLDAGITYYFVVVANYNDGDAASPIKDAKSSYIAELAMGGYYGCVRLNTGGIKCWGKNDKGQLGVDDTTQRKTATSVSGMRAKRLSAGSEHSCAIEDLSDHLYCWGYNVDFRLGLSAGNRYRPTLVNQDKLAKVSLVTAGISSTCAVAAGNNYCWGKQYAGGLGNGVTSSDPTMDAQRINDITPDVKQFAVSNNSGCAIDASDDLWCWGSNSNSQVGDGTNTTQLSPVHPLLQGKSKATMLDGTYQHYCVVDNAKKIQCWGNSSYGKLGIGSNTNNKIPQYVITSTDPTSDLTPDHHLSKVSKVATGYSHSCALIKDGSADSSTGGKVRCWGESDDGRIGTSTDDTVDRKTAGTTDISGINNAIDIAAGGHFTCVLLAGKARVKCWGKNDYGQLGNGTKIDSATPVEVKWQ